MGTFVEIKSLAIRATFFLNFQRNNVLRFKLKSLVARITTHLKHFRATKFCCCKLKTFVEKSRRRFNLLQHAASPCNKLTMFEVDGVTTFEVGIRNNVACITSP